MQHELEQPLHTRLVRGGAEQPRTKMENKIKTLQSDSFARLT